MKKFTVFYSFTKNINFHIIARPASAATASGYSKVHAGEQKQIIDTAFSI